MDNGTSSRHEDWIQVNAKTLDESGRGIKCMKAVMDEVVFHSQENGTCVELIKHLSAPK
jgi:anti-sigma regulatory factor (Ser/Thr protein kinase)